MGGQLPASSSSGVPGPVEHRLLPSSGSARLHSAPMGPPSHPPATSGYKEEIKRGPAPLETGRLPSTASGYYSLYVCDLPSHVDQYDLENLFRNFDGFIDARIFRDKNK